VVDSAVEEDVRDALDAAVRARLLTTSPDRSYQFTHDVVREVVEVEIGEARRTGLHWKIASALEHASAKGASSVDAIAYHFARSDDDLRAAHFLELAGDRARERQARTAAEENYLQAVERLDRQGAAGDAARIRRKLGEVRCAASQYASALET